MTEREVPAIRIEALLDLPHEYEWWTELRRGGGGLLGDDVTLWREVDDHPGYDKVMRWLGKGVAADERPRAAKSLLTASLLPDVVHAACGVERAVALLGMHLDEAQRRVNTLRVHFDRDQVGPDIMLSSTLSVSHALSDVVLWTRALFERVQRNDRVNHSSYKVGLLPALAENGVHERVAAAYARLLADAGDVRTFANYTAHHSGLPGPEPRAEVGEDWEVWMKVPSPPPEPNDYAPETLTFHGGPKAGDFAGNTLSAVAAFVDEVLAAFRAASKGVVRGWAT